MGVTLALSISTSWDFWHIWSLPLSLREAGADWFTYWKNFMQATLSALTWDKQSREQWQSSFSSLLLVVASFVPEAASYLATRWLTCGPATIHLLSAVWYTSDQFRLHHLSSLHLFICEPDRWTYQRILSQICAVQSVLCKKSVATSGCCCSRWIMSQAVRSVASKRSQSWNCGILSLCLSH